MVSAFTPALLTPRVEPVNVAAPSVALQVKRATLTYDRTWSPYIQGSLVCKLQSAADAAATDPRKGLTAKFTLGQDAQRLNMVGWLRSRTSDFATDETTLNFASVESLLQDYIDFAGQTWGAATNDIEAVNAAVARMAWSATNYPVAQTVTTLDSTSAFSIGAADAAWSAGSSLWDVVNSIEETQGIWIRGDESGVNILRMGADYSQDTTLHSMSGSDRILSVADTVDRDSPDWANGYFYSYPNASNATDYGVVGSNQPLKSIVVIRQSKKATSGAAQSRAVRASKRGRNLSITAVSDLSCRPNQSWRVQFRGYDWTGKVQAVTFRYPEGLMDITLNIVE